MITLDEIKNYEEEIVSNYKKLHQIPEIGFNEFETSKYIQDKLDEYGVDYEVNSITGVVGNIVTDPEGKTFAIRADMDALPISEATDLDYKSKNEGMMHACGHDAHVSMLLGAAKYLSENRDKLKGNVRFIFQPSEEGIPAEYYNRLIEKGVSPAGGAATMVKNGVLEGVDGIFAIHVAPDQEIGEIGIAENKAMASSDRYKLEIIGKGGHGAVPQDAVDPTAALSAIITGYNQLPSREFSALENIVLSIGEIHAEGTWNAIPNKVELTGTYRTFNNQLRDVIADRMEEIAVNIAKAYRCDARYERVESCFATINNEDMVGLVKNTANNIFGQKVEDMTIAPSMGAEDVGAFFEQVPGAIAWLGVKGEENGSYPLHNPNVIINTEGLIYGSLLHINLAINFLKGE